MNSKLRIPLCWKERQLLADMPIIPLYFYVSKRLVKPWVGGYTGNIMDHHHSKDLFILEH